MAASDTGAATETDFDEMLAALWQQRRPRIVRRLQTVEDAAYALLDGSLEADAAVAAHTEAHKLAGSLGTYGFPEGSWLARQLEMHFARDADELYRRSPEVCELVNALREELESPAATRSVETSGSGDLRESAGQELPFLLLAGVEREIAERVEVEASGRGYRARAVNTLIEARAAAAREAPDLAVLDAAQDGYAELLSLTRYLSGLFPPPRIFMLAGDLPIEDRLALSQAGCRGFIARGLSSGRVMDTVQQLAWDPAEQMGSVMLVDGDPDAQAFFTEAFSRAGYEVHAAGDPLRILDHLQRHSPDMLVVDVAMPSISSFDICRLVRSDSRWADMPVLCRASSTDAEDIERLYSAGADDVMERSAGAAGLVTRVSNRLERSRTIRRMAGTDPLTGVSTSGCASMMMERLISLSRRQEHPLALAALSVDHLSRINEEHGSGAADEVLRRFGQVMTGNLRGEDVVGRFDGEEFVIAMYGVSRAECVERVRLMLDSLRAIDVRAPDGGRIPAGFSAGVAAHPIDGTDLRSLLIAARQALQAARQGGGCQVLAFGDAGDRSKPSKSVDVVVVDDDEVLSDLLLHALGTRGYTSRWFDNGPDALRALSGSSPEVSAKVVLLDVGLPGMEGLDILSRLKEEGAQATARFIMLTGRSSDEEVVEALERGAFDHVAKPFSVSVLMQRIRRALEE